MPVTLESIVDQVADIEPVDEIERTHREDALTWLGSTDDVFRRIPPRTPPKHLVSYFLLRDPLNGSVLLLVDHRKAGLWLPTGGHVDPGEGPVDTVRREVREELGIDAEFADDRPQPHFITVTETTGSAEYRHTDVSLWFLLNGSRDQSLVPDMREFASVRWWTPTEVAAADPARFDPHLGRFLGKIST